MTENDKIVGAEKQLGEENAGDDNKENPVNESEEKEPEEKVSNLIVQDISCTSFASSLAFRSSSIGCKVIKRVTTIF